MLFAEALLQSVEFWATVGLLMAVILGGAVAVSLADRWRKRQAETTREGIGALSLYREMYEDGELDQEEYRVIRDRLAAEVKGKPAGPPPGRAAGAGGGAKAGDSPGPPPESPEQAPPIS